jgi:enoyl-CoA hydratase/carnithine racemase
MDQPLVNVERNGRIARVQLANPARRNALGRSALEELYVEFSTLGADPDIGVIVLSATGPAFSAGHDIAEMIDRDEGYYRDLFGACSSLMQLLRSLPQPVIAAVDGVATAAGCQLVAGCDLAVVTERSTFATPGIKVGLFCSTPLVPISRAIGPKRVMQMLLTARPIDAATALAWGLVNQVVPVDQLGAAVDELANQILEFSGLVLSLGKSAFYNQAGLSEPSAYEVMNEIMTANAMLPDAQEGMRAFAEKRPPTWGQG